MSSIDCSKRNSTQNIAGHIHNYSNNKNWSLRFDFFVFSVDGQQPKQKIPNYRCDADHSLA